MNENQLPSATAALTIAAFAVAISLALLAFYCYVVFVAPEVMSAATVSDVPGMQSGELPNAYHSQDSLAAPQLEPGAQAAAATGGYEASTSVNAIRYDQQATASDQVYDSTRLSLIETIQQALSRYYAVNSIYPPDLTALVPQYLPSVFTMDPQSRASFPYMVTAQGKGYVLGVHLARPSDRIRNAATGMLEGEACGNGTFYCVTP